MASSAQSHNQLTIIKEVFIDHIVGDIHEHYEVNPNVKILLSKCVGEGGFGQVFKGKKRERLPMIPKMKDNIKDSVSSFDSIRTENSHGSCQYRAIKRIILKNPKDKKLMQNQMEILSYLDHPSIVKLYETYEYKKQFYLVTDLLKGGELLQIVNQKGPLPENDAKIIFQQLIKALCYLHSQNICHRDLKLENILLSDQRSLNIKLIDFGLAFCWDQNMRKELILQGEHKNMTGTPDYMSPEMIFQNYDEKCDIWSAGVILYILLSGTTPFTGDDDHQTMKNIKKIKYTFQKPEFQNVSMKAKSLLQNIFKYQNERITIQQILNDAWLKQDNLPFLPYVKTQSMHLIQSSTGRINDSKTKPKLRNVQSFDNLKRKSSAQTQEHSEIDSDSMSCHSQNILADNHSSQLTVAKIQNFINLSKLLKFISIYSVSKLSDSKITSYGIEFSKIDKDNNGTISLDDLRLYLDEKENFDSEDQVQLYFDALNLSKREFVSYTEYLACVLSYQALNKAPNYFDFDNQQLKSSKNQNIKDILRQPARINIFNDQILFQLFCFLDKDYDDLISDKDFQELFQKCGILERNETFLCQIKDLFSNKVANKTQKKEWAEDPRKFKEYLSRTYKGEKDGGSQIDFEMFREIVKEQSKSSNDITL